MKSEAIAKAKKTTGLLKKSIKVKRPVIPDASHNPAHHGKPAYVIVGPDRDAVGAVATINGRAKSLSLRKATKRVLGGGKVRTQRPSRYAHLVEKGIAGHKRITPAPFIEPAVRAGEGQGLAKFTQKLESGLAAEVAKLPK